MRLRRLTFNRGLCCGLDCRRGLIIERTLRVAVFQHARSRRWPTFSRHHPFWLTMGVAPAVDGHHGDTNHQLHASSMTPETGGESNFAGKTGGVGHVATDWCPGQRQSAPRPARQSQHDRNRRKMSQ